MNDGRMRMELVEWNGGLRTAEMRGSDGKRERERRGGVGWGMVGARERWGGENELGKGVLRGSVGARRKEREKVMRR